MVDHENRSPPGAVSIDDFDTWEFSSEWEAPQAALFSPEELEIQAIQFLEMVHQEVVHKYGPITYCDM